MANTRRQFLLLSLCIMITQATKGAFGMIWSPPSNLVVYEGATNTALTCIAGGANFKWKLLPFAFTGNSDEVFPTTNGGLNPSLKESFAIDNSKYRTTGAFTLFVLNATISPSDTANFSTAGVYWCHDHEADVLTQLVVIRSDPVCSSNVTQSTTMLQSGDVVQLFCTIVYGAMRDPTYTYQYFDYDYEYEYGIIDAVMTWSVNGHPVPADNVTFTINSSPTEVTASSKLLINYKYDATYECATTFSPPSGRFATQTYGYQASATNAPDYFKTCTISLSGLPTSGRPTHTTTLPTTTTTTKTSSAPAPTPTTTTVSGLPTTGSPAATTTLSTTTTTTKTSSVPAPTTAPELPPCSPSILQLLMSPLLRASCYDDWMSCSPGGMLCPNCRNRCRSLKLSDGTCMPTTSVGCPCIPPGNQKCHCF